MDNPESTSMETEVLVIGGGATGAGVARDLAMRGVACTLVEQGDLSSGTTGRYHGLLHSGGRYAVKDPQAAAECIQENRILRRILPFCIEDTGGFFVSTPWDDPEYPDQFLRGCRQAGIPVEEIPVRQMLKEEPALNPAIRRCFRVPDASADSFLATEANVASARQYGARILRYHRVTSLVRSGDRIVGARVYDRVKDQEIEIRAAMLVNASGAWAGKIAALAGIPVTIVPGKGVMLAANHRVVNTVINRCKLPSDGDILVPAHTVAIIGTTDVPVSDPERYTVESWEVDLLMAEAEKLVPGFKELRILRLWAGVRPLYQESGIAGSRDLSRAFVLLDHETRDGVSGMVTITSGKWTTYRKMAEATADLVCARLGFSRPCRTHQEELPAPPGKNIHNRGFHTLGSRLREVEREAAYGQLVCECELATVGDVTRSIIAGEAQTIDDVRRETRLGMGPCQGGFCTFRVAGLLHQLRAPEVTATNAALRDFLQERWKGLRPVLWGQQLRQEYLDTLIYRSLLNVEHLPGAKVSTLAAVPHDPAVEETSTHSNVPLAPQKDPAGGYSPQGNHAASTPVDVLVVGAGLAGLVAGWQAASQGRKVRVQSAGWGALLWSSGCIDVLGYDPASPAIPVIDLRLALDRFIQANPEHPYALAGLPSLEQALAAIQVLSQEMGYPLQGSLDRNWLLPSASGAFRPTCLAPITMLGGDLHTGMAGATLVVGFAGFQDFYPSLVASNLQAQGVPAQGILIDLPVFSGRRFVTNRELAGALDHAENREMLAQAIREGYPQVESAPLSRIGFPAVLGLERPIEAHTHLQDLLGLPVFEIPTLPPSIPGIRLTRMLMAAIERQGGRVFEGMRACSMQSQGNRVTAILSETAARQMQTSLGACVLATGGILGGGIVAPYDAPLQEVIAGLPVAAPASRTNWLLPDFFASHPIYHSGVRVNQDFQPVDAFGQPVFANLFAAGTMLAGASVLAERSMEGVALVSGYLAGNHGH